MTNHNADYIWKRLPFAQGLQYQTAWYLLAYDRTKGMGRVPVSGQPARTSLQTVI